MRFVLLDEIGRGATGRVHVGWDRAERRHVAVKVLGARPAPAGPTIAHPHVLPQEVHGGPHGVLVVMPLVRGGSLLDLSTQEGRLPEAYVAAVLDQLLQALVAVHARGVVHRDVKAANVLLEPTGAGRPHVRLGDFGDETTIGTPGYLAPEVEAGAAPGPGQDVYGAGVVARRLLDRQGPLLTLADSMTRPEAARRPTAAHALARLRALPVPRAGRWPVVPDRLGPLPRRR